MSWETDLAKEFKNRNNESKIGNVVGTVLSIDPLKIGILNNKIILDSSNSYLCSNLIKNYERKADVEIKPYSVGVTGSVSTPDGGGSLNSFAVTEDKKDYNMLIKYKEILKVSDEVLVATSENDQTYFIIDKIIKG